MSDHKEKLSRLRSWLKKHELDGVVLTTRANFAWLTDGGDNHVVSQEEVGVGAMYVTVRGCTLFANRIEMPRIIAEENTFGATQKDYPWTTPLSDVLAKACKGKRVVGDDTVATGLPDLPEDFVDEVRASLTPGAVRQYKALGRDTSLALETVARSLSVGDSGYQAEADLARHLLARGIQPHVLLVAFDDRLKAYRHPTPTANHLRKTAMLVACGQKNGLIASVTRLIHFGKMSDDLKARHASVCRVEAAMWKATTVGSTWGSVLKAGIAQYKEEGFAKEWELHHQGGPTGYAGRDILVGPDEKRLVLPNQAVAWNPSITGTKTEDTFILGPDNERTVLTTSSPSWPTITVLVGGEKFERPDILVR
jgi:Xaa-Pro aminopeptidase